ncbi:hypothetical protein [Trujillonella humicola]|uniref:hypothetical protein n=1 Tax=Trujillonella humicola TaxID=3383699 RepID=UPI003905F7BE
MTPDVTRDILEEAWRPGTAPPVAVHVRPEVHARLVRQAGDGCSGSRIGTPAALPLVVDEGIPAAPGFEVHRAVAGAGLHRAATGAELHSVATGSDVPSAATGAEPHRAVAGAA